VSSAGSFTSGSRTEFEVLVECPDGLCELRAVLLKQQAWRDREGIT
jgi:hypothetical protein